MQTPTQGRSPRFRVAKPLKGFAPLLFRECRRLSSCKRRICPLFQEWASPPPCFCLGDGESLCQKGDSPMKHRSGERCYHQRNGGTGKLRKTNATETLWREEWPNSWRITYNRPCVSYREPYPLPLSSVMVSYKKVSCYDTRYADQNQPMCICHSQPPFLFPARRKPTMTPTVRNSASL